TSSRNMGSKGNPSQPRGMVIYRSQAKNLVLFPPEQNPNGKSYSAIEIRPCSRRDGRNWGCGFFDAVYPRQFAANAFCNLQSSHRQRSTNRVGITDTLWFRYRGNCGSVFDQ